MPTPVRIPVEVGGDGIISVHHSLGTTQLEVVCEMADGRRVGYLAANPISDRELEVVPVPGGPEVTAVILSRVENPAG